MFLYFIFIWICFICKTYSVLNKMHTIQNVTCFYTHFPTHLLSQLRSSIFPNGQKLNIELLLQFLWKHFCCKYSTYFKRVAIMSLLFSIKNQIVSFQIGLWFHSNFFTYVIHKRAHCFGLLSFSRIVLRKFGPTF